MHLELTAPGVETQPYHMPWTDPGTLEHSDAPEHLQYVGDIIIWGNTAEEVFEIGKKTVKSFWKPVLPLNEVRAMDLHRRCSF